jgi:hypothetical protein
MVGIILLFGRTVGGGAGGERRQGDKLGGTYIAVASCRIPRLSLPRIKPWEYRTMHESMMVVAFKEPL